LTDSVFRQEQDDLLSANLDNLPPVRTAKPNRWRRDSNRDEANPAFTLPPPVPLQPTSPPDDPKDPPPRPPPDPPPDAPQLPVFGPTRPNSIKGMKEAGQQKRIIIIFGDGSFSPSSPGKLSLIT
jgi:hypothetical protein